MAKAQKPKRKKGQRKKFFEASIPLTATKVHLYGYSPEELVGNMVKLDLTRTLRGKNLELSAQIKLEKDQLIGELKALKLMPFYLKKVMRRGTDYVEDSFEVTCKDARLRIKPFMITRKRVSRSIRNTIRKAAKKYLENHTTIRTTEELFSEIMTNKLQKELAQKIKKIYPLGLSEIRILQVIKKIDKKTSEPKKEENIESKKEDDSKK